MVNENISVHLILWYYFLPIHKNNVNSEIINYTKLCKSEHCAKHIDYNHAIIDWHLLAALKSITENTFYGKKIQFVVSKI